MGVIKVVFAVLLSVVVFAVVYAIGAAIIFGFAYLDLQYFEKWRYQRYLRQAEEFNQQFMADGHVLRVSVRMQAGLDSETNTNEVAVFCFKKKFAREGGLKSDSALLEYSYFDGPNTLAVPIDDSSQVVAALHEVCGDLDIFDPRLELAMSVDNYRTDIYFQDFDFAFHCRMPNGKSTSAARFSLPEIVGIKRVPAASYFSQGTFEALGPHDRKGFALRGFELRWFSTQACWSGLGGTCVDEAEKVCGVPMP